MKKNVDLSVVNNILILLSVIVSITYAFIYVTQGDYLMIVSSLLVMLLPLGIYLIEEMLKISIPSILKTGYLSFVLISAVLGAIANFYGQFEYYDKFVHFFSGVFTTLIFIILFRYIVKSKFNNDKIIKLGTVIFNTAIAAFWEICEFSFDLVFKRGVQRGFTDTMTDMIAAIIGGLIIILFFMDPLMRNQKMLIYKKTK
jgi:hypothetical protein